MEASIRGQWELFHLLYPDIDYYEHFYYNKVNSDGFKTLVQHPNLGLLNCGC